MHLPRRNAFTLLELLVVIVLLGVLASFMWPDFETATRGEQLDESAQRLKSLIGMCRAQAMNEARVYRVTFRLDGRVKLTRQLDAILAPQEFYRVREIWASTQILMDDVWVEAVLPLPDGPVPIIIEDELIEFDDMDDEPIAVQQLDAEVQIDFHPDGSSDSVKWVLRDVRGRGIEMTLDGRLGRVDLVPVDPLLEDEVERPELLEDDEEEEVEPDRDELERRR